MTLTPQQRWDRDTRELRFPESLAELTQRFILTETRRVSSDNVIPVGSVDYEVPRGHAGERITVARYLLGDDLRVLHDGRLVRVHPVDRHQNALSRRAHAIPPPDCDESIPTTAAEIAFAKDLGPLIGPNGDYEPHHKKTKKGENEP